MQDKFWELTTKYFSNEADEAEIHMLSELLEKNEDYQKTFDELALQWNMAGNISYAAFDRESAGLKVNTAIAQKENQDKGRKKLWWSAAAVFLCLLGLVPAILFRSDRWTTFTTTENQHLKVLLPDSSSVWLNRNALLAYNFDEEGVRKVRLKGEAYFEVARDSLRPFVIESPHLITRVLGTSFNINTGGTGEQVSVIEGKVAVKNHKGDQVLLRQGDRAEYLQTSGRLQKVKVHNIHNTIAWKDEIFDFDNIPMGDAMDYLSEAYDVSFEYANESIKKCMITASFEKQSLKTILNIICLSVHCEYRVVPGEKKIVISGEGC
ncbi:FecR family protein [Sinomicrobium oceani]|uniref:FecR family protein n=1 Tax=Sinomicrobium oceani TaxID=1150368 RepID=A0A1K1MB49_9FLAO|nr:FecR family protein [Sinomicrobium oceani]SFW20335.1 FecR family protein [Sinomicrobium oceani]